MQAEARRQEEERAEKLAAEKRQRQATRAAAADAAATRATQSSDRTPVQDSATPMDTSKQDRSSPVAMDTSAHAVPPEQNSISDEDAELQAALAMSMDTSMDEATPTNAITVSVKWIATGKDYSITCSGSESIGQLRQHIADAVGEGVSASQVTLICAGKRLETDALSATSAGT